MEGNTTYMWMPLTCYVNKRKVDDLRVRGSQRGGRVLDTLIATPASRALFLEQRPHQITGDEGFILHCSGP